MDDGEPDAEAIERFNRLQDIRQRKPKTAVGSKRNQQVMPSKNVLSDGDTPFVYKEKGPIPTIGVEMSTRPKDASPM